MPTQGLTQNMIDLVGRYEGDRDATIERIVLRHNAGVLDWSPIDALHERYTGEAVQLVIRAWGPVEDTNGVQVLGDGEAWRDQRNAHEAYEKARSANHTVDMSGAEYDRAKDRARSLLATVYNPNDFIRIYNNAEANVKIVLQEAHGTLVKGTGFEWNKIHNMLESDRRKRVQSDAEYNALIERVKVAQAIEDCYRATRQIFTYFGGWNSGAVGVNIANALQRRGIQPEAARAVTRFPIQRPLNASAYLAKVDQMVHRQASGIEIDNVLYTDFYFSKSEANTGRVKNWSIHNGRISG